MDTKTSDWRPGPSVCRCCLTEGCYKDISTEYFWMGKKEVYSEMLSDTFSISIAYSQSGGPNSNSRLICEPCIARLRDASDFRRQVVECEKTFMQHLDPGTSSSLVIETHPENMECEVKLERVKLEKRLSDDELDDPDFLDDDDDDMDDEPLTKLASKVPKKESVDLLDLLDNSKSALKRKSTTKTKASPAKKSKTKKEPAKAASSKATKPEKKKKDTPLTKSDVRGNAEVIIKYTTAYPFRVNVKSLFCVYCGFLHEDPVRYRQHMDSDHRTFKLGMAFEKLPKSEYVKVDMTDLSCRVCSEKFPNLKLIATHLKDAHNKTICPESELGVIPFIFKGKWNCALCEKTLPSLLHLNKHTITHFLKYVCDICGKSYVAKTGLLQHARSKHEQELRVYCRRCRKIFSSMKEKIQHQKTEKKCMPYCCNDCTERFPHWEMKQRHLIDVHGLQKERYRCNSCEQTFSDRRASYDHYKICHTEECLVCLHCGLKFACRSRLNRHLGKHTA